MALGSTDDDAVLRLLAVRDMSTTELARELSVDDGELTQRLINVLNKDRLVKVVGADGNTPVWGLTPAGRERVGLAPRSGP